MTTPQSEPAAPVPVPLDFERIAAALDGAYGPARPAAPSAEASCEPPAPNGATEASGGDREDFGDYAGDEHGPSDADPTGVDAGVLEFCAGLDHSDTDNGLRLRMHFGQDLAVLKQTDAQRPAFVAWAEKFWDVDGGPPRALAIAQKVGGRISLEADFLAQTPPEKRAIAAAERAAEELAALEKREEAWTDTERGRARDLRRAIEGGKDARAALDNRKKARRKFAVSSKNKARLEAMQACAAPFLIRDPDEFNAEPLLVATEKHTLCFSKSVRRELDPECPDPDVERFVETVEVSLQAIPGHRREDLITKILPVAWNPEARCPRWEAFLEEFLPVPSVRRSVQIFSGLGLLGLTVQKLFFHYGGGANGKSVFLETLCRVLGPLAVGLPAESITGNTERGAGQASPDLARLYGARFLRVLELPGDRPLHEDLVKKLTGGEKIPVRSLFKGYMDFRPVFTGHMSGNAYPRIDGTDNGIWRRMAVIHWPVTIPEDKQRNFDDVLADFLPEYPGILVWLVEGAKTFLREGLVLPEEVREATQDYRDEMDPIGQFCADCVEAREGESVPARQMFEAFVSWCMANAKTPFKETRFGRVMKTKWRRDEGRIRRYLDCALHDVPARPERQPPRNPYD